MTTFNAVPSEQAGMLLQALRENKQITIQSEEYLTLWVDLLPQRNTDMTTMNCYTPASKFEGQVTLHTYDALAVACALFEGVVCMIDVKDKNEHRT